MLDFGAWASERYRVPTEESPEEFAPAAEQRSDDAEQR